MKKFAPLIVAGAVLAYLFFKKRQAGPKLSSGSANQADNAKRTPARVPATPNNSSALLSAGIGALGGLLGKVLPGLLRGGGGGGSSGGSGIGLKPPSGSDSSGKGGGGGSGGKGGSDSGSSSSASPDFGYDFLFQSPETQTTLTWESGEFNPFDNPADPGNELSGGVFFNGFGTLPPIDKTPGQEFDYGGELPQPRDLTSLTNANDYQPYDSGFLWSPNYDAVTGQITNPSSLFPDFGGPAVVPDWTQSYGFENTSNFANPNDYYDTSVFDPSLFADPFADFYDYNSFDFPSGTYGGGGNYYSYDSGGGGEEKRAGGGGGGGYSPTPSQGGGGGGQILGPNGWQPATTNIGGLWF